MQINNNYHSPSFGVKVSPKLPEILTENLPPRYRYKDAIKDIQNQTEKLADWGSDFLEITTHKNTETGNNTLVLEYKNQNELKRQTLKAVNKNKTKTQLLSLFLSLKKDDVLRAEKALWADTIWKKPILTHRTQVSNPLDAYPTIKRHIKFV